MYKFGYDIKPKIDMGSKYKFVPKEGPPPGQYDPDLADRVTKPKQQNAVIAKGEKDTGAFLNSFKTKGNNPEAANDPGQYSGHLKPFGADVNNKISFGDKYKFYPKEGPPPGSYDVDRADAQTKPKTAIAVIKEETSPYRRPKDSSPEPGQYDDRYYKFGYDIKPKIDMGSKYKWQPKEGPAPGQYDVDYYLL